MKKKIKVSKLRFEKFTVAKLNNASAIQIKGGIEDGGGNDTVRKTVVVVVQGPQMPPPVSALC